MSMTSAASSIHYYDLELAVDAGIIDQIEVCTEGSCGNGRVLSWASVITVISNTNNRLQEIRSVGVVCDQEDRQRQVAFLYHSLVQNLNAAEGVWHCVTVERSFSQQQNVPISGNG